MNLWIESQNKSNIVKVNNQVGLKYDDNKTIIANYIPDFSDKYDGSYDVLGTYQTKERALEVLKEIKSILKNDFNCNKTYQEMDLFIKTLILNNMSKLYEMPKE